MRAIFWLGIGIFLLWCCAVGVYQSRGENPADSTFPTGFRWAGYALFGYFVFRMFLLLWLLRGGYVTLRQDEYLLEFHGAPPQIISRAEYFSYVTIVAKFFSAGWMVAYYLTLIHLWFLQKGLTRVSANGTGTTNRSWA